MSTHMIETPHKQGVVPFEPDQVFFEPGALNYPLGQELFTRFKAKGTPIQMTTSHNQVRGIPGETEVEQYRNAKRTLVVGVRKTLKFDTSKPSAEYAIPLSTGCMGHCHYCYLQTTLGAKPYIRVYVNIDEILAQVGEYIAEHTPQITRFEAACTSDPVGIEHITGNLKRCIEYIGKQKYGRLRFVTKFAHVEPLLDAHHNGHTRFRFSINADYVIKNFEPATSTFLERIEAAGKVARAGYPLGFIIAPLYRFDGWQDGYRDLLERLAYMLPDDAKQDVTFELIQHRYTKTAKAVIEKRYPKTKLEMNEENRQYKWGRYGRGKYVYKKEAAAELEETLHHLLGLYFPSSKIEYFT